MDHVSGLPSLYQSQGSDSGPSLYLANINASRYRHVGMCCNIYSHKVPILCASKKGRVQVTSKENGTKRSRTRGIVHSIHAA